MIVKYALANRDLAVAQKAIQLSPGDAQAHLAGAVVLSSVNRRAESLVEMERAVALRPADHSLWLQLGLVRDELGETDAALAAFDEAVRLAPFYARPRWQRGNLLLRAGQYDQAFKDLSQAAQSNPELIPSLVDLAWNLSKGDPTLTEEWAQIKTGQRRIAFARFLVRQGRPKEAIAQFRAVGTVPESLTSELVEQLMAKGAFEEAFEIWRVAQGSELGNEQRTARIYDGGFEAPLTFDAIGFVWRVPRTLQGVALSLNSSQPHSGSKYLRIDFGGDSNPGSDLISQFMLVEPSRKYQVNFASSSQDVVTGGLPLVVVADAKADRKVLGQSAPLPKGTGDWQVSTFEFTSSATTTAVLLSLRREGCSTSPCPIFGSISIDSFSMALLK